MKTLRRNCREFQYYAYIRLSTDKDENEFHTGVWQPIYDDPVTYRGNISAPSGSAVHALDGIEVPYTHVLVMDDPNVDIKETGYIVWNEKTYDIMAVRPSLNVMLIALQQRAIDNGNQALPEVR